MLELCETPRSRHCSGATAMSAVLLRSLIRPARRTRAGRAGYPNRGVSVPQSGSSEPYRLDSSSLTIASQSPCRNNCDRYPVSIYPQEYTGSRRTASSSPLTPSRLIKIFGTPDICPVIQLKRSVDPSLSPCGVPGISLTGGISRLVPMTINRSARGMSFASRR